VFVLFVAASHNSVRGALGLKLRDLFENLLSTTAFHVKTVSCMEVALASMIVSQDTLIPLCSQYTSRSSILLSDISTRKTALGVL